MRRPLSLWTFALGVPLWFVALTLLWMPVSPWTSFPAALLARAALPQGASGWVRAAHATPHRLEVDTRIEVFVAGRPRSDGVTELVVEAEPAHYAYGLPLFLALLAASRSRRFARRAAAGYLLLLVPQAFSLSFDVLRQIVDGGGGPLALGVAQWQLEAIALGYQCGSLLLPALAPVMLWLWFERRFLATVLLEGWLLRRVADGGARP
jgi:hypothetical protein